MLMEGITIINQTEIVKPNMIFIILGVVLFFISAMICSKLFFKKDGNPFYLGLFAGVVIIIILVSTFFSMRYSVPTGKYEYQVTIDDSVSMNKFYEKYEIIEVNGKIFTIIEKE